MMLWFAVAVALVAQSRGENLASCANTDCGTSQVCRIINRCWGKDCQVGTICINALEEPVGSGGVCMYEKPVLTSLDGGVISEQQCVPGAVKDTCPAGTACKEPEGICCTGAMKSIGTCPAKSDNYYLSHGECKVFCRHDQECPGFERCCETVTGCRTCMKPVSLNNCETHNCGAGFHCVMKGTDCLQYPCFTTPTCIEDKPGICPIMPIQASCADQCKVDSHCPLDKKCCRAGDCNVCISPSVTSTQSPTLNFNGGFGGLGDGSSGDGSNVTVSPLASGSNTGSFSSSGFPNMSDFMSGGGDGGGTSGGSFMLDTSLGSGGFGDNSGSSSSSLSSSSDLSSSGSGSINPFNMLNSISGMQSGGSSGSTGTNPLSSMQMDTMKTMQSGGSTATDPMASMMDAMKTLQNAGSTGTNSMASMLGNVQDMMNKLNPSGSGGGSSNPFGGMLNTLNSPNNSPSGESGNSLSSLGGLSPGGGGGGLDPVLSGNTLTSMGLGGPGGLGPMPGGLAGPGGLSGLRGGGGGGLGGLGGLGGSRGGGGGLAPSGLNPQLPMLGGRNMARRNRQQQRGGGCGMMCMMMFSIMN